VTRYEGFLARVFQHELDHLQGKVFLDRVETTLDVMMEQEWQRQVVSQRR
jgi:peptide deformylase